jgi:hypothetical protein
MSFFHIHVVQTASRVGRVSWWIIFAISHTSLLLSRNSGLGCIIQLLGALIGVMPFEFALITGNTRLVTRLGYHRRDIRPGRIGVEVVATRSWRCMIEVVAGWAVGIVGTWSWCRWPHRSRGETHRWISLWLLRVA